MTKYTLIAASEALDFLNQNNGAKGIAEKIAPAFKNATGLDLVGFAFLAEPNSGSPLGGQYVQLTIAKGQNAFAAEKAVLESEEILAMLPKASVKVQTLAPTV